MRVAVESTLSGITNYLKVRGCEVSNLADASNLNSFDAIVVSGQDDDFLGMEDIETEAVVIDAEGLTPQEIYDQIRDSLS